MEEQAFGQHGALKAKTAVVGKSMGLNPVVAGSAGGLESVLKSGARIANVKIGEALAATHSWGALHPTICARWRRRWRKISESCGGSAGAGEGGHRGGIEEIRFSFKVLR
ncbi:hypothetical protein L0337_41220 [candidate division KSB1 bacterium]|nr:hypothetical protein [candidate division KSB1 bacterium]